MDTIKLRAKMTNERMDKGCKQCGSPKTTLNSCCSVCGTPNSGWMIRKKQN